jgi:hypothetical protein
MINKIRYVDIDGIKYFESEQDLFNTYENPIFQYEDNFRKIKTYVSLSYKNYSIFKKQFNLF